MLDPGDEIRGFQTGHPHRPALVVGALGPEDVRAAVTRAAGNGMPVAVQNTGHGLSTPADGGVLVSLRRMDGVRVDPEARTADVGGGARWEQVVAAAAPYGLAPLSGSAPGVGAVGYTLGGGLSVVSRRYGYAADHVRSFDVVTADGRARRVTATEEPDLFWALRGAGANFGVVTRMTVDLVPVARVYGGGLYFAAGPGVLEAYRAWSAGVPDEMTSSVAIVSLPDIPDVPGPLRGRRVANVRIVFAGDGAVGEKLVAPLREVGPRLMERLGEMPYADAHTIYNDPATPHAYHGTAVMLADVPRLPASVDAVLQLNRLGGALARPPEVPNAVGHRDARYLLRILSPGGPADVRAAHQRLIDTLDDRGRALNFLYGPQEAGDVRAAYDPAAYARLREIKAAYDPANMFRFNHNIPAR